MLTNNFKLKNSDYQILSIIIVLSIILTAYYIQFNVNLGIYCSDVFIYLLNASYYNGNNITSLQTIYLSPVICFLTAIIFKTGIIDKLAIYLVTGTFAIVGNIGFYLLLKTRFNEILSLTGTVLYSTFALNLTWLANGTLDIPATSITIWIVLFTILSIKYNPKYYLILFPLFIIGFFTRYTTILIFPVLVLYYLCENSFTFKNYKYILIGLLISIVIAILILISISNISHGYIGVFSQISGGISGNHGSVKDLAFNTDISYYLSNLLNFISSSHVSFINRTPVLENPTILSYIIVLILIIGIALFLKNNNYNINKFSIFLFLIAILTFNHISSFITILIIFLALLLTGKNNQHKTGIVMLSWILVYLIFFSYYSIKVNRYIIPAIPPLIYLIIASINLIHENFRINKNIIPILLIGLFLIQGFAFTLTFEDTNQFKAPEEISEYIITEIPDWQNQLIGVYNIRYYQWYLGSNVNGITSDSSTAIDSSDVNYYISDKKLDLNNFTKIKSIDNLYLYERRSF